MKKFVAFVSVVSLATFSWAGTAKKIQPIGCRIV